MTRVCHLTSAHQGLDIRIFHKECVSLANSGYDTHVVIVASPDEVKRAAAQGVTIHSLPLPASRTSRMLTQAWRCFTVARRLDADLYHFHDPELIPYGIILALHGKVVVYDVHEDVQKDILSKRWIPASLRKIVSMAYTALEYIGARYFFTIVTATESIAQRFKKITMHTEIINNFPILNELDSDVQWGDKDAEVCYVGGIAKIRGITEVCQAMGLLQTNARLNLCGRFAEPEVEQGVKSLPAWQRVNELGFVDRSGVRNVLSRSAAGLVTFHPAPNHLDAQPNKMFEYMSAGIPVIASDFPLWREIIQGNDCGLLVNPLNPAEIAQAIDFLVLNPDKAQQMGANGRKAAYERYNWAIEEQKLLAFYEQILRRQTT